MRRALSALALLAACTPAPRPDCPNDTPSACPSPAPSYVSDVAPIVSSHCLQCHAPGGQAQDKPLGTQAYRVTIKGNVIIDRRRVDDDDNCASETYEPV